MNHIINLVKFEFLNEICRLPVKEVLVQTDEFSRVGGVGLSKLGEVIDCLKKHGKKVVLAWDQLVKDHEIQTQLQRLTPFLEQLDGIRVLDTGLGAHLKLHLPEFKLQLSLEHGSLNSLAIEGWLKALEPQIDRVVLSPQIPSNVFSAIRKTTAIDVEILVFGDLEMFYSRRKLLPAAMNQENLVIASDDRPKQRNRIVQTDRGTIVYYDRRLNLLPNIESISKEGIQHLRMECFNKSQLNRITQYFNQITEVGDSASNSETERETTGFFEKNLTDKLFKNLTNRFLSDESENKIGSVLDSVKNDYTIVLLQTDIELPCKMKIISPEGKNVEWQTDKVVDLKQKTITGKVAAGIYQLPWIKYAVPGSLIML